MIFDENENLEKLIQAANAGDREALRKMATYLTLARSLENPILDELNDTYVDTLASEGDEVGLIMKGNNMLNDNPTPEEAISAIKYFLRAVLNGEDFGIECIGEMFFEGRGVKQDYEMAFLIMRYVLQHALEVNSLCYYELGKIAKEGYGVISPNPSLAQEFFERAIEAAAEYSELDDYAIKAREELKTMK